MPEQIEKRLPNKKIENIWYKLQLRKINKSRLEVLDLSRWKFIQWRVIKNAMQLVKKYIYKTTIAVFCLLCIWLALFQKQAYLIWIFLSFKNLDCNSKLYHGAHYRWKGISLFIYLSFFFYFSIYLSIFISIILCISFYLSI